MNPCPNCGQPMPALNSHGKPRKYCSAHCCGTYTLAALGQAKVRDMYAEEVEHLASFGTPPARIVAALNIQPLTLARALQREGRPELARPIERYGRALRRQEAAA